MKSFAFLLLAFFSLATLQAVAADDQAPQIDMNAAIRDWDRVYPQLTEIVEADSVVPFFEENGLKIQVFGTKLNEKDSALLKEKAEALGSYLRSQTKLVHGALNISFCKKNKKKKDEFNCREMVGFDL